MGSGTRPEYKANEDTAPETFSGDYEGRKSEGGGVIAILSMIKEDIENEVSHIASIRAIRIGAETEILSIRCIIF